jgi:hypothetical protein
MMMRFLSSRVAVYSPENNGKKGFPSGFGRQKNLTGPTDQR